LADKDGPASSPSCSSSIVLRTVRNFMSDVLFWVGHFSVGRINFLVRFVLNVIFYLFLLTALKGFFCF
jgi:hypothetical protein